MKKLYRVVIFSLVFGMLATTFTACGGGSSASWYSDQAEKATKEARKIYKGY